MAMQPIGHPEHPIQWKYIFSSHRFHPSPKYSSGKHFEIKQTTFANLLEGGKPLTVNYASFNNRHMKSYAPCKILGMRH